MALETALLAIYTTAQLGPLQISPLALDLDGDGIRTINLSRGVRFDISGDGILDRTGWLAAGDGFLSRDLDGDGIINSGAELFGSVTRLPDGSLADDGFQALSVLDSNSDGRISHGDISFDELRVWVDSDTDGVTDPGELKTLTEAGVSSIDLKAKSVSRFDQGNLIALSSTFETTDAKTREVVDVWFSVSLSEELDQRASVLGEVLRSFQSSSESVSANMPSAAAETALIDRYAQNPGTVQIAGDPQTADDPSEISESVVGRTTDRLHFSERQAASTVTSLKASELGRALREFEERPIAQNLPPLDIVALNTHLNTSDQIRRNEPTLGQAQNPGGSSFGGGGAGDD